VESDQENQQCFALASLVTLVVSLTVFPRTAAATFDELHHHFDQAFDATLAAQTHLMQPASIKQQDIE